MLHPRFPIAFLGALAACTPDARALPARAPEAAASASDVGAAIPGAPAGESALADLAVDGAGRVHALLVAGGSSSSPSLVVLSGGDGGWAPARTLASGMGRVGLARLAAGRDGGVDAFWYAAAPLTGPRAPLTELDHARLEGGGWTAPRALYTETANGGIADPALAPAPGADGVMRVVHAAAGRGLGVASREGSAWRAGPFADRDGHSAAWVRTATGGADELAYVGTVLSPGEHGNSDVFVRALGADGWSATVRVHADPKGYSHFPVLLRDGRGVRHLFWLEDTGGDVIPEALFHSRSEDGRRWTKAEDVTPPALAGGILWMATGAVDGGGGLHLLLRASRADRTGNAVHHLRPGGDGRTAAPRVLVPSERMGTGDALLARDPVHGRVAAAWRAADGGYRWAWLPPAR